MSVLDRDRVSDNPPRRADGLKLTLRNGAPTDAPACASILNDWIDDTPWMPRIHSRADVERHYHSFVFRQRRVIVAEDDGLLGYVALDLDEKFITSLYVAEGLRGRGVGAALMNAAKALSPSELNLWTFVANAGAQRFYLREGFAEIERSDGDNEEKIPDICFRWAA